MASFHAIAVTANAIRGLLANACPKDRFPGADFKVYQAANFATTSLFDLGVSIYLYRVVFNTSRRNLPPRTAPDGRKLRPPTPVDLHFLLTAWAKSPDQQQELLGWAIRTLQDTPALPAGLLNRFAGDRGEVFRDDESIELIGEILSLQDAVNIWEVAKNNQQPSVSYLARMISIDSEVELTQAAPAQTRGFDYAVVTS
jgi:hypothetical protein